MKATRYYWPAAGWTLIILFLTLSPGKDIPEVSFFDSIPDFDKVVHAILFAGFVALWSYGILKRKNTFHFSTVWRIVLIGIMTGVAIEFIQLWWKSIHRDFETGDMLADAAGALLGAWAIHLCRHILFRKR